MVERSQNSYPLLREFREFYAEVARLRRVVAEARAGGGRSFPASPAASEAAMTAPASAQAGTEVATETARPGGQSGNAVTGNAVALSEKIDATTLYVQQEMSKYLDQKQYEVKLSASSISHDQFQELVYIMAAFADETFVCLVEWPGKDYWRDHLMELRLFHTQIAGQDIYRKIDTLLERQDYGAEELAAVYLMALALGFKGLYLRAPESVEAYRKRLFDRLLMTNPDLRGVSYRLFPDAYRHTVVEGSPVRLPEPRTWWLAVAGIVATWLVGSTIAWTVLTGATGDKLDTTRHALGRVMSRQWVSATTKWTEVPLNLQNGAFRVELPANVPLNIAVTKKGTGTTAAPVLISVQRASGTGAARSDTQVKAWLSSGSISFLSSANGLPIRARAVSSVEQMQNPPSGVTASGSTLFFFVDLACSEQELAYHPQLSFPANGAYGVAAATVTLYLPDASTAGAQ